MELSHQPTPVNNHGLALFWNIVDCTDPDKPGASPEILRGFIR
jgi:hypothetical protein